MKSQAHRAALLLSLLALSWSKQAAADPYRRPGLGGRWVNRQLTAPMNSLAVVAGPGQLPLFGQRSLDDDQQVRASDGGFAYVARGSQLEPAPAEPEQAWMRIGVIFGLTDDWEAGALFVPIQLAPEQRFAGILAYVTRGFRLGSFDIGVRLALQTPEHGVWGLNPALVLRKRWIERFALDASLTAPIAFGDRTSFGLNLPVRLTANLGPRLFGGVETGYYFAPRDRRPDSTIPLGALVGLTSLVGSRVFDVTALFSFDEFLSLDPGSSGPFAPDAYRLMAGLTVHQLVK